MLGHLHDAVAVVVAAVQTQQNVKITFGQRFCLFAHFSDALLSVSLVDMTAVGMLSLDVLFVGISHYDINITWNMSPVNISLSDFTIY